MWIIRYGLLNGGGIAESMRFIAFTNDNLDRYFIRWIYDVSFFIAIPVIFLNIIFGIIIDTFKELRDEKNNMYDDMQNICYICGIERLVFDKEADGFENHIERDHQLWNYIEFLFYLNTKD